MKDFSMTYRIDGFRQIESFYSWVFNNPDKVRPTHVSLYLFLWNQNNRSSWCEWFKCPYDLAMQGACIGNNNTYYKCLDELKEWGLIDYKKGVNNFKAPLISLKLLYESEQLTEQVTVPQCEKLIYESEQQTVQQYAQQHVYIYNYITNNIDLIHSEYKSIEKYIESFKNKKPIIPSWRTDIEIYKDEMRNAFKKVMTDIEWIKEQEYLNPNLNILKSIEKSCMVFWATNEGWENKKSSRKTKVIDWKQTWAKTMDKNKVYKQKINQ